ncbi:MAG: hypothetical protein A3B82_02920 [Methylophilales bacterium RIFCSPHIGHO2_02_FULL_57_10]|nr:MAG: hypothetical protein A3B82_02920 [Methylophilales bacterium RIFCSPHIGHO2_02_FULL_57_10]
MAQTESVDNLVLVGLRAELKALQEFKATLQAEQKALVAGDVATLTALSQSKLDQIDHLNRLATKRLDHIASLGFTANRHGMDEWAEHMGTAALDVWRSLLKITSEAHQANQVNGTLIQTHLQHNQQALAVLLAATNRASLYGSDGQPEGAPQGGGAARGIIGKA